MGEQAGEQRDVGARRDRRDAGRPPRWSRCARGSIATIFVPRFSRAASRRWNSTGWHQARLEPTSTHEVGLLQILVDARHGVRAEGAAVAGDGRRHAEARIGVDIGRADKTLHQLVGDVIILDQQLARDVEGDAVGPMRCDRLGKARGDAVERLVPAGLARRRRSASSSRPSSDSVSPSAEPLEQSRPKLAGCSGSPLISALAVALGARKHAAADAAIGAGRASPALGHHDAFPSAGRSASAERSMSIAPGLDSERK